MVEGEYRRLTDAPILGVTLGESAGESEGEVEGEDEVDTPRLRVGARLREL